MVKDYSKYLISKKRQLVLDTVEKVCTKIRIPILIVNFEGCPGETDRQLAHFHPDTKIICISDHQLAKLDFHEIRETIIHEITHFFELGHDGKFQGTQTEISVDTWEAPPGTVVIRGDRRKKVKLKSRKFNPKECNFFDCTVINSLHVCEHCTKKFCSKHIRPKAPQIRRLSEIGVKETIEWQEDGHACPDYAEKMAHPKEASLSLENESTNYSGKGVGRREDVGVAAQFDYSPQQEPRRYTREELGRKDDLDTSIYRCSYYRCWNIGETSICQYCGARYCSIHLNPPKPCQVLNLSTASAKEIELWRREDGHPCTNYAKKKEEELNEYGRALDALSGRNRRMHGFSTYASTNVYKKESFFAKLIRKLRRALGV